MNIFTILLISIWYENLTNKFKTMNNKNILLKNPYVYAFIFGIIFLLLYKVISESMLKAPPPLVKVSSWSLVDEENKNFGTKQLIGKVYIANYFFTRCPSICPKLIKDMNYLVGFYKNSKKINFVSFTVDPSWDKPEILNKYKKDKNINYNNWSFLTGDKKTIKEVIINKMKLHVGNKDYLNNDDNALYEISHTGKFVLFDQNGDIRGLFSTDKKSLKGLMQAADLLIKKGPNV